MTRGWYREETLRSGYVYQIYAYLRSQEGNGDPLAENASGLLLHPSVGDMVNEAVVIQNHEIRFATVDLAATAKEIREQLLKVSGGVPCKLIVPTAASVLGQLAGDALYWQPCRVPVAGRNPSRLPGWCSGAVRWRHLEYYVESIGDVVELTGM